MLNTDGELSQNDAAEMNTNKPAIAAYTLTVSAFAAKYTAT